MGVVQAVSRPTNDVNGDIGASDLATHVAINGDGYFIVGYTIRDSAMGAYLDYLDPALVTLLCLVALPVPAKILVQNAREVLMFAPDADVQAAVEEKFRIAANALPVDSYEIRMLKMGDTLNVLAHVRLSSSETINSVAVLDEMRRRFREEFDKLDIRVISDVVFTNELPLTDRSGDQS